jgi:aspartate/methionine/tyrosine aminotransferase
MFSRRLAWSSPRNRLARRLGERRAAGAAILDLTESNPTRAGLPYPAEAIAAALADPGAAAYDPRPRGAAEARGAVAAFYARRGHDVDPERVVLTASTSEAYAILFKLLADPGDAVLVPRPSYPLFDYLAALESVRAADYPIVHDGRWRIDLEALEGAIRSGATPPRALVVVSPNNPTGSALRASERDALEALGARHGLPILSDEVFFDYLVPAGPPAAGGPGGAPDAARGRGAPFDPVVSMLPGGGPPGASARGRGGALAFVLGGLSKSCGLPQMKLAWIVVAGPEREAAEAIERMELVADTYLSVGTPVQLAAARLLEIGAGIRTAIRARVAGNLAHLEEAAAARPACRLLAGDGGWSAVLQAPAVVPEEDLVLGLLSEDGVLVHPGYFFDFPREVYLVVSLLPPPEVFREGVRRLLARVAP